MNKTKILHISWYLDGRKESEKRRFHQAAGSHWPTQSLHVLSVVSATRRRGHCLRRLDDDRLLLQPAPLRHGLAGGPANRIKANHNIFVFSLLFYILLLLLYYSYCFIQNTQ